MNAGNTELQPFLEWLKSELLGFVAVIEEGSVAAGDPYQEGFSDHDLNVVVDTDTDKAVIAMSNYLEKNPLGNTYLISPRLYSQFLQGDTLNDLSLKFRSRVLAGRDVVAEKSEPDREEAIIQGRNGLQDLMPRFERRWLNISHWTLEYSQHKNYDFFKGFFVFAAAIHYGKTGHYPTTRVEAADLLPDQEAAEALLYVVNNIADTSKDDQRRACVMARRLIPELTN